MIQKSIVILGIVLAVIPHLGFPNTWEEKIVTCIGLIIAIAAFIVLRRNEKKIRV